MGTMIEAFRNLQNEIRYIQNENERQRRRIALANSIMNQAYRRFVERKAKKRLSDGDIYGLTHFVENGDISEIGEEKLLALAEDLYDNGETDNPKIMKLVITIIDAIS